MCIKNVRQWWLHINGNLVEIDFLIKVKWNECEQETWQLQLISKI